MILSIATRVLSAPTEAEDVAQDTFVAAYQGLPRFGQDAKFSTWLYRIGLNKCRDQLRARRPVVSLDSDEAGAGLSGWEPIDAETPLWELEQLELGGELEQGIRDLPDVYREAFLLRHVEGLGYEEMSDILSVHRDTLKMRVYKARLQLCKALAHLEGAYR